MMEKFEVITTVEFPLEDLRNALMDIMPDIIFENAEDLKQWMSKRYLPEELFDSDELEEWALENGFVEE